MSVTSNSMKAKLAKGHTVLGCLLAFDAPWLVEIIGRSGFDFVTIDIEHEAFNERSVVDPDPATLIGRDNAECPDGSGPTGPPTRRGVSGVRGAELRECSTRRNSSPHPLPPRGQKDLLHDGERAQYYGIGINDHEWMSPTREDWRPHGDDRGHRRGPRSGRHPQG